MGRDAEDVVGAGFDGIGGFLHVDNDGEQRVTMPLPLGMIVR
jgi:hypothetical protein